MTTTQKTQHTPGPWHRNIKPASHYNTIFAGRNTHVCHLTTSGLTEEEIEANCNLIKSAPALLEALKTVSTQLIEAGWHKSNWEPLLELIAQAEGQYEKDIKR